MEFSRPEYWSGQPVSSPADLPDPGIELGSPALQMDFLPAELPGKPIRKPQAYSERTCDLKVQKGDCIGFLAEGTNYYNVLESANSLMLISPSSTGIESHSIHQAQGCPKQRQFPFQLHSCQCVSRNILIGKQHPAFRSFQYITAVCHLGP